MTITPEIAAKFERDLGRIEGSLKAHEDRMDRTQDDVKELSVSVNNRFDGVKLHLDKQDEKLDVLIRRSERDDGADSVSKLNSDNSLAFWTKVSCAAIAIGTVADLLGHSVLVIATHLITGHQ